MIKLRTNERVLLFILIFLNLALLSFSISSLSISYDEAKIYYESSGFLHNVITFSTRVFGQNDYALRLPFLFIHSLNTILIYKISKPMLRKQIDRMICATLYMYLPGVLASATVVNEAGFIIFLTLLFIFFEQNKMPLKGVFTLIATLFLSESFINLYIAVLLFGLYKKDKNCKISGVIFCLLWFYMQGIETYGKPKGHFIDALGVFAAVFSPLVFLCFIYSAYRIWIKEEKNLLWFISITAFFFALGLSMRQKLSLELFLPYCVIFMPLIVKVMLNSYRVRLPMFRTKHKIVAVLILSTLFLNSLASIFHTFLYLFLDKPQSHFAYKYDVAKELSDRLKKFGISSVKTSKELALRLKFYGISSGDEYELNKFKKQNCENKAIRIVKFKKMIDRYYICKIK